MGLSEDTQAFLVGTDPEHFIVIEPFDHVCSDLCSGAIYIYIVLNNMS
jgi:hypothetical protein